VSGACAALQSMLDQVTLQVRVSYEAINTDLARIRLGKTTIGQAGENLRLTGVKYNNGTATPTDMVDAQTALIRAQTTYITAVYSYLIDLAQLQYAMGNDQGWLLEQLKLQEAG
jgi:outer membrane protein